jgi:hypothetical protein
LEFAKTRVQLRQEKGVPTPRNPFYVVTQVYQKEGIRALYKGCGPLVLVSNIASSYSFTLVFLLAYIMVFEHSTSNPWSSYKHLHMVYIMS